MKYHLPAGTAATSAAGTAGGTRADGAAYVVDVTPEAAGWAYSGLRVLELDGGEHRFDTGDFELLVLPLSGSCRVTAGGESFDVQGRSDLFSEVTDFVYAPRDSEVVVAGTGRFALPAARCENRLTPRYGPAAEVPVELRGAGMASRRVQNFCTPDGFPYADKLIACEVFTPAGCWSSYPPHKHDEDRPGESVLEEIYYFEVARGGNQEGTAYMRTADVLAEVRSGDVVLVPDGWHGPSMAPPGYDLYYLNVMAGPAADRAWRITDDPAYAWVRGAWPEQAIDPRLR